jgi:hypothetical protein
MSADAVSTDIHRLELGFIGSEETIHSRYVSANAEFSRIHGSHQTNPYCIALATAPERL